MQVIDFSVQSTILEILQDIIQDWDLEADEISLETELVADLSFASIDIIHFVVAIEDHFKQKFGFAQLLMQDGRYVDDLSVEQIVNFVSKQLNGGMR
ncbi:MAG: acyl carrier protein [Pelatocladus maniniholoensis HA4357-MV3]|jgi:acyl carrier protein|uniref:Acyl carrier protein n=1 Tax=Pelatocladus maniniholoensis HA4357-MV3 TaxID=1117104 RepID=A0A9E3H6W5_9NOST|nr:acyl carrier protein [Pelatocladus maniniholoensis HA4357-MV3]